MSNIVEMKMKSVLCREALQNPDKLYAILKEFLRMAYDAHLYEFPEFNKSIIKSSIKRAGAYYCANQIARHIGRKVLYSGIVPKPSYMRNIRRYVHWFLLHSSEEEWVKRVSEAYYPYQMFFSAKHLLSSR